jgi:hypothetical protein
MVGTAAYTGDGRVPRAARLSHYSIIPVFQPSIIPVRQIHSLIRTQLTIGRVHIQM